MGKEITIKLPDGTVIQIPSGDTESLKTALSLVTGKTLNSITQTTNSSLENKITNYTDLVTASKIDRIASIIRNHYPEGDKFTSNEVCELYEVVFREGIKISTVSTYLSRLADEEFLIRQGNVSQRYYSLTKKIIETYGDVKILEIPPEYLK